MNNIFRVIKVSAFIRDKINFIQLHLDKKYINYVTSTNKQNEILQFPFDKKNEKLLGISLLEVELLVGYNFIPVFFMPGEKLPNGKIAKENNSKYYIKAWKILPGGQAEKIKTFNTSSLLKFEKIKNISVLKTYVNLIHIYVEGKSEPYLYTIKELTKVSGLKALEFNLLTSSFISPVCYLENEISEVTGWIIPKHPNYTNTIIKEINLRVPHFVN